MKLWSTPRFGMVRACRTHRTKRQGPDHPVVPEQGTEGTRCSIPRRRVDEHWEYGPRSKHVRCQCRTWLHEPATRQGTAPQARAESNQ
jgi:hypothetical protein